MKGCFPYLDDITIAGVNQSEHDINLKAFFEAASAAKITINELKTQLSQTEISILGYKIGFGYIKPDPDRVQPLFDLPLPQSTKELQRIIGLFAYYARWIPSYSKKVRPLIKSQSFPLTEEAILSIKTLKDTLASAHSSLLIFLSHSQSKRMLPSLLLELHKIKTAELSLFILAPFL